MRREHGVKIYFDMTSAEARAAAAKELALQVGRCKWTEVAGRRLTGVLSVVQWQRHGQKRLHVMLGCRTFAHCTCKQVKQRWLPLVAPHLCLPGGGRPLSSRGHQRT